MSNTLNLLNIKDLEPQIRALPSNISAEQLLLGHILTDNDELNKIADFLRAEHFFEPVHQRIFGAISSFTERGIIANPITLKNSFENDAALREVGGAGYLAQLASLASTIVDVRQYARVIYDLFLKRELIKIGTDIVNDAHGQELEISSSEQIEAAEQKLYNISTDSSSSSTGFLHLKSSLAQAIAKTEAAFRNKNKVSGIATSFIDIDETLGGFQNSDLVIIAGRPAMGKTALALNIAFNCAQNLAKIFDAKKQANPELDISARQSVGFFSLEMSADQLASRLISTISKVNTLRLRTGHIDQEEFFEVMNASKSLYDIPLFIDDTPALSISALRTRARRLKRRHNLGILFVDYLQLIRATTVSKDQNRVQEISEITQGLKAIAKELDIPVIALSQLSRAVEQRESKRPLLSDLRESGSIEQDADIVSFIYREEYYLSRKKPSAYSKEMDEWQKNMEEVKNVAELIIAKHRNGPTGDIKLYFDSSLTKFDNFIPNA